MRPPDKSKLIKSIAIASGFDAVGITRPLQSPRAQYYRRWLQDGHAGTMKYLRENADLRQNPAGLLDSAKSVVCVALNYKRPDSKVLGGSVEVEGRVAQYARGLDYHRIIREMLDDVLSRFRAAVAEPFEARICVDTAPVLERDLAAAAGLGWIGKNTMVLNQKLGSFFFLGELFVTLELEPDAPETDHCGTCTRCLDACPTGAFPNAYEMNASRCVSYLTIEHRGDIPDDLAPGIGDWVYGCDICQDVCPFNRGAPDATHPGITEDRVAARLPLLDLLELRSGAYRRLIKGTAMSRASRKMLQRNAAVALKNGATT